MIIHEELPPHTILDEGEITEVKNDYTKILLSNSSTEYVDTKAWRNTHKEPSVGQTVKKVTINYDKYFKFNFYGFIPSDFKPELYTKRYNTLAETKSTTDSKPQQTSNHN